MGFFADVFHKGLSDLIREGSLTTIEPDGRRTLFGAAGAEPSATVRVHNDDTVRKLVIHPELAVGEAYMDGTLTVEEGTLESLLDLLTLNLRDQHLTKWRQIKQPFMPLIQLSQQYNPPWRARRNVAHHYDLSDELYSRFLDSDRQYSCAYFRTPHDDLETAQAQKKRHIAAKLAIEPGMRVLDIGSGWGGLAIDLARTCGAHVTGITLSREQLGKAQERAQAAGVADRVTFQLRDYREITETFDRVVSVGMFEHVGVPYYQSFFNKLCRLLTEDGVALLHSIGRPEPPGDTGVWSRKYIFPGGYAPALSEVLSRIEKSGLLVADVEILRMHYAMTLKLWHANFARHRAEIAAIYDERFCRMWEFYLLGAQMEFRNRNMMNFQIQMQRKQTTLPITRDYMLDREREMPLG